MDTPRVGPLLLLVALASGLLVSCGDTESGSTAAPPAPTVVADEVPLAGPAPAETGTQSIVAHGGAYFGINGAYDDSRLVRSEDLRTWEAVELPGQGTRMSLHLGAVEPGGVLAVSGRVVEPRQVGESEMHIPIGGYTVWTSADGTSWEQGPVLEGLSAFDAPIVHEVDGVLLVGTGEPDGRFTALRRDGDGAWSVAEIPELARTVEPHPELPSGYGNHQAHLAAVWNEGDTLVAVVQMLTHDDVVELRSTDRGANWTVEQCSERDGRCGGLALRADGLLVRGERSSTDEGRTWESVEVTPTVDGCEPEISAISRVGSTWTAVGSVHIAGGPSIDGLLHSEDGRSWTSVLGPQCDDTIGESAYRYSSPIEFNGTWWSVYSEWLHLSEEPPTSRLVRSDDGRSWTEVEVPGLDGFTASSPQVVGDELLVPLFRADDLGGSPTFERVVGLRAER